MTSSNTVKVSIKIPWNSLQLNESIQENQFMISNASINTNVINLSETNVEITGSTGSSVGLNLLESQRIKKYIDDNLYSLSGLPANMIISTISATGKINCKINLENIDKYMKLSADNIMSIKYSGKLRSLEKKKTRSRKHKDIRCFENQLTMEIKVNELKKINVKIFKNGSFQMTGCKSITDCNIVINKLIFRLTSILALMDKTTNEIVEKPFIDEIVDPNNEIKVYAFKIDMINSNFSVNYLINRESLYNILLSNKINCRYEPCIHACVNIKFQIENEYNPNTDANKIVSIFVFQSGNIIITGARNKNQICKSYEYINTILQNNYNNIVKKDLINLLDNNDLKEILEELENMGMDDELFTPDVDNIIV